MIWKTASEMPDNTVIPDPDPDPINPYGIPYRVTNIDGASFSMSVYRGKTLLVYFTGASCIPCKAQLPYIINGYNTYKGTGKVEVISFDIQGNSIASLKDWRTTNGITWQICQDSGLTVGSFFSVSVMPTLIVCDEDGHEITRYIGQQTEQTINNIFINAVN